MKRIRIYADEDVTISVCKALRLRGFEAFATIEENKCENSDIEQLEYATSIMAVLLPHNIQDFPRIHYEFMKKNFHYHGIIVAKQVAVGEIIKCIVKLAATLSAEDMCDRLEYLSNWQGIYLLKKEAMFPETAVIAVSCSCFQCA